MSSLSDRASSPKPSSEELAAGHILIAQASRDPRIRKSALNILIFLIGDYAINGTVPHGAADLARFTRCCPKSAKNAIKALAEGGYLMIIFHGGRNLKSGKVLRNCYRPACFGKTTKPRKSQKPNGVTDYPINGVTDYPVEGIEALAEARASSPSDALGPTGLEAGRRSSGGDLDYANAPSGSGQRGAYASTPSVEGELR